MFSTNILKWFLLLPAFMGLVLATGSCTKTSIQNNAVTVKNGIEYTLETDQHNYRLGESVNIVFRVTNETDEIKELGTVYNCEYCMCQLQITLNEKDIWKNCRVPPPCGQKVFQLNPQESWEYMETWNMINDNGTLEPDDDFSIGKGKYKVTGALTGTNISVLIEIK